MRCPLSLGSELSLLQEPMFPPADRDILPVRKRERTSLPGQPRRVMSRCGFHGSFSSPVGVTRTHCKNGCRIEMRQPAILFETTGRDTNRLQTLPANLSPAGKPAGKCFPIHRKACGNLFQPAHVPCSRHCFSRRRSFSNRASRRIQKISPREHNFAEERSDADGQSRTICSGWLHRGGSG